MSTGGCKSSCARLGSSVGRLALACMPGWQAIGCMTTQCMLLCRCTASEAGDCTAVVHCEGTLPVCAGQTWLSSSLSLCAEPLAAASLSYISLLVAACQRCTAVCVMCTVVGPGVPGGSLDCMSLSVVIPCSTSSKLSCHCAFLLFVLPLPPRQTESMRPSVIILDRL